MSRRGSRLSTAGSTAYGTAIRSLRAITQHTVNREPKWRHTGAQLTTGYHGRT